MQLTQEQMFIVETETRKQKRVLYLVLNKSVQVAATRSQKTLQLNVDPAVCLER